MTLPRFPGLHLMFLLPSLALFLPLLSAHLFDGQHMVLTSLFLMYCLALICIGELPALLPRDLNVSRTITLPPPPLPSRYVLCSRTPPGVDVPLGLLSFTRMQTALLSHLFEHLLYPWGINISWMAGPSSLVSREAAARHVGMCLCAPLLVCADGCVCVCV